MGNVIGEPESGIDCFQKEARVLVIGKQCNISTNGHCQEKPLVRSCLDLPPEPIIPANRAEQQRNIANIPIAVKKE